MFLTYYGILSTGEKIEIIDDKTFLKNISIIIAYYKKIKEKKKVNDFNIDDIFKDEVEEEILIPNEESNKLFNVNEYIIQNMKNKVTIESTENQNNIINSLKKDLATL